MRIEAAAGSLLRPEADLSDLTDSVRDGSATWDGDTLCLPFDVEPTAAEQALIRRRLMTRDAEHEAWVAAVCDALAAIPSDCPSRPLLNLLVTDALRGIDGP